MLFDQHVHSVHSEDGGQTICEIAEKAVACGLAGVTITDHFDLCTDPIGYPFYMMHEEARKADFAAAQAQYGDRVQLRWGLELGNPFLMPGVADPILAAREFDFILGSVHYTRDGRDVYLIDFSTEEQRRYALDMYFEDMLTLLADGGFDSLAHLDYPLRVMKGLMEPTMADWREPIEAVLETVVRKDLALEVNTRGFMDWKGRQEPEDWVLRRFYELGGRMITVGSDAHVPQAVGGCIDRAHEKLAELGFEGVTVFTNRKPELMPF